MCALYMCHEGGGSHEDAPLRHKFIEEDMEGARVRRSSETKREKSGHVAVKMMTMNNKKNMRYWFSSLIELPPRGIFPDIDGGRGTRGSDF